jgi:hypothetical protein
MVSLIYRHFSIISSIFKFSLSNFAEVIPQKIPAAVALAHMLKKPEELQQQQQPQKQQQQVEGH